MNDMRLVIRKKVSDTLDLIVTRTTGFKARVENMQCMAIDARLDTNGPDTPEEDAAVLAGMLVAQQVIFALDNLADDIDVLTEEILNVLSLEPPSRPQ
jgi:hypothetical protein